MILILSKHCNADAAALHRSRRWWLGWTMGDMLGKACNLYPEKAAVVGGRARLDRKSVKGFYDYSK